MYQVYLSRIVVKRVNVTPWRTEPTIVPLRSSYLPYGLRHDMLFTLYDGGRGCKHAGRGVSDSCEPSPYSVWGCTTSALTGNPLFLYWFGFVGG